MYKKEGRYSRQMNARSNKGWGHEISPDLTGMYRVLHNPCQKSKVGWPMSPSCLVQLATLLIRTMADPLDQVMDAFAASRSGPNKREPVGYEEFQKIVDSTPLFMRETPQDTEGDYVLEALKSLVFEGEGDG